MNPSKKKLTSVIFNVLFIIIVVSGIFLTDIFKSSIKNSKQILDQTLLFASDDLGQMTKLTIKNKNGEFIFEKQIVDQKNQWIMISPKSVKASSLFIEKLYDSLKIVKIINSIDDTVANSTNFSLVNPNSSLILSNDQQKIIAIDFGLLNAIDKTTYIRIQGKPGIIHLEAPSSSLENIQISDLIESKIFNFKMEDIKSLAIDKKGSGNVMSVALEDSNWKNDKSLNLDPKKINSMLTDLLNINSAFTLENQSEEQKKQTQKIIANTQYTIKFTLTNNTSIVFYASGLFTNLQDVTLNEEEHFMISSPQTTTVYVIKKEFLNFFNPSKEVLQSLEAPAAIIPNSPAI
jgi:hypothetical protein